MRISQRKWPWTMSLWHGTWRHLRYQVTSLPLVWPPWCLIINMPEVVRCNEPFLLQYCGSTAESFNHRGHISPPSSTQKGKWTVFKSFYIRNETFWSCSHAVVGWIRVPKDIHNLISVTCESYITWSRGLCSWDKVKDLNLGRWSWIIQVGSKWDHKGPYTGSGQREIWVQEERRWCEDGPEGEKVMDVVRGHEPRDEGSFQQLERQGIQLSPRAAEGNMVLQTLISAQRNLLEMSRLLTVRGWICAVNLLNLW